EIPDQRENQSIAETQPQLQPALLRLSAMMRLAWRNSRIFASCFKRRLGRPDLFVHDRQRPLSQKFRPAYETNTEMDCPCCFCPIATRIPVRVCRVLAID